MAIQPMVSVMIFYTEGMKKQITVAIANNINSNVNNSSNLLPRIII